MRIIKMLNKFNFAFTLIELLIVVLIIAILAAIAVPNLLEFQTRAKISRAKADMRTIATAMEAYRVENNEYPRDWDAPIYGGTNPPGEWQTYRQLTTPVAYMSSAPRDLFNKQGPNKPMGLFDYWGYDSVVLATLPGNPNREAWIQKGINWMIYSYGPDRIDQRIAGEMMNFANFAYDPTNGTVSVGDFGRNNTGIVP